MILWYYQAVLLVGHSKGPAMDDRSMHRRGLVKYFTNQLFSGSFHLQSELLASLERSVFAQHLSPANLARLVSSGRMVVLEPGQTLFREGEENGDVYVVLSGQVDLTMTVPGRGATRILSVGDGELLAWSAILGNGTMTCSATCTFMPSTLLAIDARTIKNLVEVDHEMGYQFMKMMASALAGRLLATRLQLLDLFSLKD